MGRQRVAIELKATVLFYVAIHETLALNPLEKESTAFRDCKVTMMTLRASRR